MCLVEIVKEDYRSLPTFHLGIKIRVFLHEPRKRRKRLEEKMNSDLSHLTRLFKDQISRCENHHLWAVFKQWESAGLLSLFPTLIVRLMRISEGWGTGHLWNAPFCLSDESRDSQLWTLGRRGHLLPVSKTSRPFLSFCFLAQPVIRAEASVERVAKNHSGLLWSVTSTEQGVPGRQDWRQIYGLT